MHTYTYPHEYMAHSNPRAIRDSAVSFVATDASDFACGGGLLRTRNGAFTFALDTQFVSDLPHGLRQSSSAVREATAILWLLQSLHGRLRRRVIVFTDSSAACGAIRRGSRSRALHAVVRRIFMWCLHHNVSLFPCWVPRDSATITKADEWSRIKDRYGQRTPPAVFALANHLARHHWASELSFDRMASHLPQRNAAQRLGPPLTIQFTFSPTRLARSRCVSPTPRLLAERDKLRAPSNSHHRAGPDVPPLHGFASGRSVPKQGFARAMVG